MIRKLAMLALVSSSLAGCATPTPTSLDKPDLLPERVGVAAIQVVTNQGSLSPMLDNWTSIYAFNVEDPESRYELKASSRGLLRSRVFVGALPPGRYSLLFMQSLVATGNGSWWINARIPSTLGVFEVADATLTTLGTIVYQPLGEVGEGDERRGVYAVVRAEDPQLLDGFIADLYPEFHARLDSELVLGWETGVELTGDDSSAQVKEAAYGVTPIQLADGRVAFGATLGQIYWREADGSWVRTDTSFVNEIATVAEMDDGYVAGGERGLVLVAPALEGPWSRVQGPSDTHAVYWLYQHGDGHIYALARSATRVTFFRVSADFAEWTAIHTYHHQPGLTFTGAGQVHAFATKAGRIMLFGGGERRNYDPATNQSTVEKSDEYFLFAYQPNGKVVSVPGSWWSGVALPEVSANDGADWERTRTARGREYRIPGLGTVLPYALDDGRILMVMHKAVAVDHLRRKPSEELYTRIGDVDGEIERWGAALEPGCHTLLPTVSTDRLLFLRCDDGRIMTSSDLGASWQIDRDRMLDPADVPVEDKATQTI